MTVDNLELMANSLESKAAIQVHYAPQTTNDESWTYQHGVLITAKEAIDCAKALRLLIQLKGGSFGN